MVTLDGSLSDGGGHVLRAALGLSMVTSRPFRMTGIRAGRAKPGLMRRHLAAVNAAARVCGATVDGAVPGSKTLSFSPGPGPVAAGDYAFTVGSAASTALVLQAIFPALLVAEKPSTVSIDGATHNPGAPPFEFVEKALAPLVNRMGPAVSVTLHRAGFYPAGGGRMTAEVRPARSLSALHVLEHGGGRRRRCTAMVAALPGEIALRELDLVKRMLDWPDDCFAVRQLPEDEGPGNVLLIEVGSDAVTEVFAAFGERGVRAEAVAEAALQQAKAYLAAGVPVGAFLAEQLLVPMAVTGGGSFLTTPLSRRAAGTIEAVRSFLNTEITVEGRGKGRCLVRVPPRP